MAGLDPTVVAFIGAGMAGIITLFVFASLTAASTNRRIKGRVARIQGRQGGASKSQTNTASIRLNQHSGSALERLAQQLIPRPAALRDRLSKTGKSISLGQYAMWSLGVAIAASLIRAAVMSFPPLLAILFGVAAGVGLPHFFVGFLIKRRIKKFNGQFAESIELIIRGLKSGLPVTESIRTVGDEFDGPVGEEFRNVADRIKLGQTLDVALWEAVKRIDLPDFKFFVISLAVQRETGGNLTETLQNLAEILRRRRQMVLKIRAMSSEAKASAIILGSLPFIMLGLMLAISGDYVMLLFTDPRGQVMLGIGAGFIITGAAVMAKMVKFEI